MMILKETIKKLTGNLKVNCEFCKKSIKRKHACFEKVKLTMFVYPKKTPFCCNDCYLNYGEYEKSAPKRVSMCSSCPVPPGLLK